MAVNLLELGGLVIVEDTDADENSEDDVLSGPATLFNLFVENDNSSVVYFKIYDSKSPSVGSDEPAFVFMIPPSTENDGHFPVPLNPPNGVPIEVGLSYACVTTGGTGGTTGPTSTVTATVVTKRGL